MSLSRVCVYCASSGKTHSAYEEAAYAVGAQLASAGIEIVYGGGSVGLMGALADGGLSRNGRVVGVLPKFMMDLEWGHGAISEVVVVDSMHERKHRMLDGTDAVIAMPGGCGTLEELFEAITWKRLGLYFNPIVLLNTRGFYDRCVSLLEHCIDEQFMDRRHRASWTVVSSPEEVIPAIRSSPPWPRNAREFAVVQ